MKKYKVIDDRNIYRNDSTCEITHDTESGFVMNKIKTDDQGNITKRVIILNPRNFQNERIVDEKEATLLILKNTNIKLEEIK